MEATSRRRYHKLKSLWQKKFERFKRLIAEHKSISIPTILALAETCTWLGLHFAGIAEINNSIIFNLNWLGHTLNFSFISALTVTAVVLVPAIIKAVIKHQQAKDGPFLSWGMTPLSDDERDDERDNGREIKQNGAEPSQDSSEQNPNVPFA
jgi:hypothetical protein